MSGRSIALAWDDVVEQRLNADTRALGEFLARRECELSFANGAMCSMRISSVCQRRPKIDPLSPGRSGSFFKRRRQRWPS